MLKNNIMKYFSSILIIYISLLLCSCFHRPIDDPQDEMKELFFCTINNEDFYPKNIYDDNNKFLYDAAYSGNLPYSGLHIYVDSDRFRNATISLNLTSKEKIIGIGKHILGKDMFNNNSNYGYCFFQNDNEKTPKYNANFNYYTTNDEEAYVTITKIDTIERRISGTFYFIATNASNEKIEIKNGKFNTKYN